uniref:Casein kinase II subunit beta n=1 Tax=Phaeomonas parva TaxID=124430 RepID=A0A6U4CN35_9STRA|mmetsp:Transcript_14948/g.45132  ORF Transcript_14948/g.45132 Transcript_14948/m.45132 type:complete len:333 (+) Transcript_14948:276-1274(+)
MSSGDDSYDGMEETWIEWFCNLKGHEFFCEVDRSYIEDGFNLYGLRNYVSNFMDCLHLILDDTPPDDGGDERRELLMNASRLYGLIHARFILTSAGLECMCSKFLAKEFGFCPRVHCKGQPVVPIGCSDDLEIDSVKCFCPLCGDIYSPPQPPDGSRLPDGAYFGRTFAHLFFMTFEDLVPDPSRSAYVPRVFGFKVHMSSRSLCVAKRARGGLGLGVGSYGAPEAQQKAQALLLANRAAAIEAGEGDEDGAGDDRITNGDGKGKEEGKLKQDKDGKEAAPDDAPAASKEEAAAAMTVLGGKVSAKAKRVSGSGTPDLNKKRRRVGSVSSRR